MRSFLLASILALPTAAQTPLPELLAEPEAAVDAREIERCIAGPMPLLPGGDTAALPALPLGDPAPVPMPNWCPEAPRFSALPDGARFPLTRPELDPYDVDTLSDESLRGVYLDQLRDRYPLFDPRPVPLAVPELEPLDSRLLFRLHEPSGDGG